MPNLLTKEAVKEELVAEEYSTEFWERVERDVEALLQE